MKTTYLIHAPQPDGTTALVETTAEQWRNIVKNNKLLPKEDRRYFIKEVIREPGVFDCMIVEVSLCRLFALGWREKSSNTKSDPEKGIPAFFT